MMIAAMIHAKMRSHTGLAKGPIIPLFAVKRTSGTTAKGSCRLRMTWLRMRSGCVPR